MCSRLLLVTLLVAYLFCSSQPSKLLNEADFTLNKLENLYSINCTRDEDCILHSYCYYNKRCTCKSGFIPFKVSRRAPVKCIKEAADIDDYCEEDIQCQAAFGAHSLCRKSDVHSIIGKCACSDDAHYVANNCLKSAYIGQPCEVTDNCIIRNRNIKTFCDLGHCICPPHHHAIDHGRDCVPTSVLYGPCNTSDSCITVFSNCQNSVCMCQNGFIPSYDNSSCLKVANRIGDPCDEDKQCLLGIHNSRCYLAEATCACQEGYHEIDDKCWMTVQLFGKCENTNECRQNGSHDRGIHCLESICQCMNGYQDEERKFCLKYENSTEHDANIGSQSSIHLFIVTFILSCYFFL